MLVKINDDFTSTDRKYFRASQKAFLEAGVNIRFTSKTADVEVSKPPTRVFRKLLPRQFWSFSVTDRSTRPYKIYINYQNWLKVPSKSDFDKDDGLNNHDSGLDAYRIALISHELAHALGHDHVGCSMRGNLADVRQQPSRSLRGCRPTTRVIFNNKSPHI